jgi:hypothetical protein
MPFTAPTQATTSASRVHTTEIYVQNVRSQSEILIQEGQYIRAGELIARLTYNNQDLELREQTIQAQIDQLQRKPIDSHPLFLASQKVQAQKKEYQLQQEIFKITEKLYISQAISAIVFAKAKQELAQQEAFLLEAEKHFLKVKEKLEWEQKRKRYQIDQASLKLKAVAQEREQNNIASALNARVLLIRTHAIHNQNLTIAIKLLVNARTESSSEKPDIEPQQKRPKSDNPIKAMKRKSASFSKSTSYKKKTHPQFLPDGGNDAIKQTMNPSPVSISFSRMMGNQPLAAKYHHRASFFT